MTHRRTLKVQERGDRYHIKHQGCGHSVPLIRLRGKWLREAGFLPGQHVAVIVEYGRLVLLAPHDCDGTQREVQA